MSDNTLTVETIEEIAHIARKLPYPIHPTNCVFVHHAVRDQDPDAFDCAARKFEDETGRRVYVSEYIPLPAGAQR